MWWPFVTNMMIFRQVNALNWIVHRLVQYLNFGFITATKRKSLLTEFKYLTAVVVVELASRTFDHLNLQIRIW
jgi:hypothetical protein